MIYLVFALLLCSGAIFISNLGRWHYREVIGYCSYKPKGYIYYFRGSDPTVVKIGRTVNLHSRLRSHRTALSNGIVVLGIVPVYNDVWSESYIHRLFANQRKSKRAEWFYMSARLWWFIQVTSDRELTLYTQNSLTRKACPSGSRTRPRRST